MHRDLASSVRLIYQLTHLQSLEISLPWGIHVRVPAGLISRLFVIGAAI